MMFFGRWGFYRWSNHYNIFLMFICIQISSFFQPICVFGGIFWGPNFVISQGVIVFLLSVFGRHLNIFLSLMSRQPSRTLISKNISTMYYFLVQKNEQHCDCYFSRQRMFSYCRSYCVSGIGCAKITMREASYFPLKNKLLFPPPPPSLPSPYASCMTV